MKTKLILLCFILALAAGPFAARAGTLPAPMPGVSSLEAAPPPPVIAPASGSNVRPAGLQPAPLPNPDLDGPNHVAAPEAGISPAFFSHQANFAGNGFSPASNLDAGLDKRRGAAAGLNWSVPVK